MKTGELLRIPHPGEHLKEILDDFNMSMYAFAKHIGVPQNRITRIVNGTTGVSVDTAIRISKAFGMSVDFWLGLQSQYDVRTAQSKEQYASIEQIDHM